MTATPTKKSILLKLLNRPKGATIDALVKGIGWQPHSVRAALTGLRKEGHEIARTNDAKGITVYRITRKDG